MIDTHAHLQDEKLINNVEKIIKNANQFGVNIIICSSSNIDNSNVAIELATKFACIYASVGIHPEDIDTFNVDSINDLKKLAKNERVVAIGEIGLDYHFRDDNKQLQKEVFFKQIKLANELKFPIVIHSRDATGDMMEIIRNNLELLKNGVCFHCFNMGTEILKELMRYGFYISLGGAITFKNANKLLDIVKECPINRLMLETDCPYMCPEPHRGEINEPKNVEFVRDRIADIKLVSPAEVDKITTQNAKTFFRIKD